jgi:plasmid segregation protein ParM
MNQVIGFDPGYGGTKASLVNGSMEAVAFPSVVGVGSTAMGLLNEMSTPTPGRRRRPHTPDEVCFDGMSYLVGKYVTEFVQPVERMDFQRLSGGPELRALFYTALHRLLGPGTHSGLCVMVGLPVEVMADLELARSTRRELCGWMVGEHRYHLGSGETILQIERVEILAQPAGSYFAWGLDQGGGWAREVGALKEMVAVCDLGFNTADLFVLQGGNVVARYTTGATTGMRRAAELVAQTVQQQHGITLSLYEADSLLRERTPRLSTADGLIDLSALVHQGRERVVSGLLQLIERRWQSARQFRHVLFTGGGSEALRDVLARHYPHGMVLPEPVTANAVGLAKYGQRVVAG